MVASRISAGLVTLLAVVFLAGCTGGGSDEHPDESLPKAATLLADGADSIADINSTHVSLETSGDIPDLQVQSLDGDLHRTDDQIEAKGSGKMTEMGQLVEVEFVLSNDALYLKGPTGDFQKLPSEVSSAVYDPSALLDPDTGIAKVLHSMKGAKTVSEEQVQDTSTYKVTGTVSGKTIGELLPGVSSKADVTFWLAESENHRPVKATVNLPDAGGQDDDAGKVVVTLSDVNEPVTVTPPT